MPASSADCFGSVWPKPGRIVLVVTEFGSNRRTPSAVPASPTACPSGCGPMGADAGGCEGLFGCGIGVVGMSCAPALRGQEQQQRGSCGYRQRTGQSSLHVPGPPVDRRVGGETEVIGA